MHLRIFRLGEEAERVFHAPQDARLGVCRRRQGERQCNQRTPEPKNARQSLLPYRCPRSDPATDMGPPDPRNSGQRRHVHNAMQRIRHTLLSPQIWLNHDERE
jgi:hypothetical protein